MPKKLTTRECRFVEHRASGLNATEAMRAIGFKGKRPDVAAAKLSSKPQVKIAIDAALAKLAKAAEVTREEWFKEVWGVASMQIAKKQFRASDKTKALELAGRALGAFKDTAGERDVIGPGLTIIIQQGGKAQASVNAVPMAPGVTLMPRPER